MTEQGPVLVFSIQSRSHDKHIHFSCWNKKFIELYGVSLCVQINHIQDTTIGFKKIVVEWWLRLVELRQMQRRHVINVN